MKRPY
ncbi:hypothetical protein YPPY32_2729, partial [Yersinia pestis PY-32]